MKIILTFFNISAVLLLSAQNLVPDPGFENWNGTAGFFMAPLYDWETAANTPDHHHMLNPPGNNLTSADPSIPLTNSGNTGAGAVYAGQGCLGAYKANMAGNSEWASTLLTSPLQKDSCYKISFYVQNKKDQVAFPMATNNWGVYFGNSATTAAPQAINFSASPARWASWPQVINDTVWHYVELYVTPDSSYTHLNIGYVGDWINATYISWSTSGSVGFYVWIDQVSVQKIYGCCPASITSVLATNETCNQNNGTIVVSATTSATFTLYDAFTGAVIATNMTGNFTGLNSGTYYVKVNDGTCSQVTATQKIIDTGVWPNAGSLGGVSLCGNSAPINLFSSLNGTPNAGGTWIPPLASGTNIFDPSIDTAGTYIYSVTNICTTVTAPVIVLINTSLDATISPAGPFCQSDSPVNLMAANPGGTWSGTGITSASLGTFNPNGLTPGNKLITYSIPGACPSSDTVLLTILAPDDPSFSYATGNYCNTGISDLPIVTGLAGGTFSISPAIGIDAVNGEVNLNAVVPGSYWVKYTTNGACPKSDSVSLQIAEQLVVNISPAGPFCADDNNVYLVADTNIGQWSGTGVNPVTGEFNPSAAGVGTVQIVYTVGGLCGDSDTISILVNPLPNADAGPDQVFQEDSSVILIATGGLNYVWTPSTGLSCDSCASTTAQPLESTTYMVTVTDLNGCFASDKMTLTIRKIAGNLFIPNAFTPNGDEFNHTFRTTGYSVKFFHMEIFDRWGNVVFITDDINSHWDGTFVGKACPQGVYTYAIRYALDLNTDEVLRLTGHVNVLR